MKYNEGDKVRVKSKEWYNNNKDEYGNVHLISKYGWMFTERDSRFCGKVVTILLKGTTSYAIVEDSCEGFWTDEMIECKVEEETKPHNNMCKQLIDEMNPNVEVNVKTKHKPSNTVSVDKAAEVFADMLIELCPELLGFGGAAKEWENEFRKRLEE